MQLGRLEVAKDIATEVQSESKWKQLGELAMSTGKVLTNKNSIDFGTTQLGEKLDTVRLPPWAENPVDFVHKHRMVLESEYASAHLHEWIDLIFGYALASNFLLVL
ncbi:hypothetical protein S83_058759 [Arachis hypogaea]